MALNKNQQIKIVVYALLAIVAAAVGYYYYTFLQSSNEETAELVNVGQSKRLAGKKLDTTVLTDKKFKELEAIKVEDEFLDKSTSTVPVADLSAAEVAKAPRRRSNPFLPF